MTRRRRAAALLGLALLLGVLAASDVAGREAALRKQLGPTVRVVVARVQLSPGERLTAATLGQREVPARYAPRGALRDARDVIGKRAAVAVAAGAYLDPAYLEVPGAHEARPPGPPLRRDERALDLVAVGDPDAIVAGTRVDVLVTDDGHGGLPGPTHLPLTAVTVLAVRPAPAAEGTDAQAALPRVVATLRVKLGDAIALTAATATAREVRLLPRPGR